MTSTGLRESKKAKTRRAIQAEALRLFEAHGYEATTIEQIAAAADISPSTFYRYYPTKEHVVLDEECDPVMVDAMKHLGDITTPLSGLRAALRHTLEEYPVPREEMLTHTKLAFQVPELRARRMDHAFATQMAIVEALAQRLGTDTKDLRLHTFAAAVVGAWSSALYLWAEDNGREDLAEVVDRALSYLRDL